MAQVLLSPRAAAARLGVAVPTVYAWLAQSDHGLLVVRGRPTTVTYYQGGPGGQGRIRIPAEEVERLLELTRVHPAAVPPRRPPGPPGGYPGITVPLGRPG
jgi:hypothetical protein